MFGLVIAMTLGGAAGASSVDPVFVPGNPSCTDLGYDFGYKPQPEPPPSGTYYFGDASTVPPHTPTGDSVTITSDGTFFDWTSTLSLDAVIVKGGPNANVYMYDPEATSDTGLSSPINPNNNQPFAISHIEFCYDFEVDVAKTAETTFTRTYEWNIDKSVMPATWDLFTGDTGTSKYTVAVTKDAGTDSDWAVSGTIEVVNNTPFDATIESVTDVISGPITPTLTCPALPVVLVPGDSLHCTYASVLPDGTSRTNTATVETSGMVGGGEATKDVTFGDPTTEVNASINVTDTNGGSWQFDKTGSEMYDRTFECDGDAGTHDNAATIVETGQSDDASVTVNCYALGVKKNAATEFTREWDWTIEKTATATELVLSPGQVSPPVTYWVYVDASSTDSAWAVSGDIWISNPHPALDADLTGVTDLVSPDIAATVDCPGLTVPAGGSLHCTYDATVPDGSSRTNTATATLQNYDYDKDGNAAPSGTTDFAGSAPVVFGDPTEEIDECIGVFDTNVGYLGEVCASDAPATFAYDLTFGPFADPEDCGVTVFENTAKFVTNDTGTTGSDTWAVTVTVPCDFGCTLTPGYWKTHSEYGPAPYDDTWALLPLGADMPFFGTGYTYYEILRMPPKGGNAYVILAHAYIAAELNVLNGAFIPSDVLNYWTEAGDLLVEYEDKVDIPKKEKQDRAQAIYLAGILDDYNNGYIGPGHCSE
jgi:hypothetical protein